MEAHKTEQLFSSFSRWSSGLFSFFLLRIGLGAFTLSPSDSHLQTATAAQQPSAPGAKLVSLGALGLTQQDAMALASSSCTDAVKLSIAGALPALLGAGISAGSHGKSLLFSITFQRRWVYFSVAQSWAELCEMHQSNTECCKPHEKIFAKWDFPQFLQSSLICCNSLSQRAQKPVWWRQTSFW